MNDITVTDFHNTIFPTPLLQRGEVPLLVKPDHFTSPETGERVDYYKAVRANARGLKQVTTCPAGWLFCVSTILPRPLIGSFSAHKSGHYLNNRLLRKLLVSEQAWELLTFDEVEQSPIAFTQAAAAI